MVLAGRPGMGKSAAMIHFARTAAVSGVPVCVFSLEMPAEQLAGRMLVGYFRGELAGVPGRER